MRPTCEPCQMGFHAECALGGKCGCRVMLRVHAERAFALEGGKA